MNERIKLLIEQAISEVDYIRDDEFTNMELKKMYIPDCFSEKFAKLIVRECAESLWTGECYSSDLALEEFERNSAKIKRHFGVEE